MCVSPGINNSNTVCWFSVWQVGQERGEGGEREGLLRNSQYYCSK